MRSLFPLAPSLSADQELFSAMYIDFMGTDAAIFRSLTRRNAVRTDQHNSKWLSDGTDPNDAKVYFFFKEKLVDNSGTTKQIHSMIARICPNDTGGQRSLVNKWTTYLKARLVCSVMDEDGTETYFDELVHGNVSWGASYTPPLDQGTVQKVVALPTNSSTNGELILEELEVFKNNAPITTMAISSKKQQLYVSSDEGVTQVSLHRCHIYGTASYRNAAEVIQYGVKNNTTFLECTPKSPQASIKWLFQKDNDRRKEVKLSERILATQQGLLIRSVQEADRGTYHCIATENGFKQTIAKVSFKVLDSDTVAFMTDKWSPWTWASSLHALQFHPKDLAGTFSHSELQMINQYCKDTRQLGQQADGSSKMRGDYSKLKALLNSRKSRNRRNQWPGS
ncbi:Semaphorin-3C, partial [Ophiophagus hannah]